MVTKPASAAESPARNSSIGRWRTPLALVASFALSQIVVYLMLRPPVTPGSGSRWEAFRGYFAPDQLAYAAIASNVAGGGSPITEPFTETGRSFYPSLWYAILGWTARIAHISIPAAWNVLPWLVLAVTVALIGWIAFRLSGYVWAPALVGPALTVGTLSELIYGHWYTTFDAHATLWGPFGTAFVLNAELVGICLVAVALALALWATMSQRSRRIRLLVFTFSAAVLGLVSNVHTYAFFAGIGIAGCSMACFGLLRARSRGLWAATVLLVGALFLVGPLIAARTGGLPIFGLFSVCLVPGLLGLSAAQRRLLVIPGLIFVIATLPQVVNAGSGILAADPFLVFRQGTSGALGVSILGCALASLPIAAIWLFNLLTAWRARARAILALLLGLAAAGILLTFNGSWGFSQEPYRLWLETSAIGLLLLAPITAWSIRRHMLDGIAQGRRVVGAVGAIAICLVGLSFVDFGSFRYFARESGLIRFDSARLTAIHDISRDASGLLGYGPCVDPRELRIATGKPVAFYNLGMAWPDKRPEIDAVIADWNENRLDVKALNRAGVQFVVADTSCPIQLPWATTQGVQEVTRLAYSDGLKAGEIVLWRVTAPR